MAPSLGGKTSSLAPQWCAKPFPFWVWISGYPPNRLYTKHLFELAALQLGPLHALSQSCQRLVTALLGF